MTTAQNHPSPDSLAETAAVKVGQTADGTWTYLVPGPPESLPPVRVRDLEMAWDAAREAALAARFGAARAFRFRRPDGSVTDLELSDRDASCWAQAVATSPGMSTIGGLSLCLRLLALVDLLTRLPPDPPLVRLRRDGAELDSGLLRLAATAPLTREARFDETMAQAALDQFRTAPPRLPSTASGARA